MKRKQHLPELLAPAGDFQSLVAAILGGADAVYIGGLRFGARALAKNFDEEEMRRAVRLCHIFGVRLYVTLNTLILDKEIDDAVAFARFAYEIGVDALIIADIGVAALIRKKIPELELHASTQMGIHNTAGADFAYDLGCRRVVLARECSREDIEAITSGAKAECEVFVHGALCVCHSGQCLFSSMVGGRSGNRGECAQPCRLPYEGDKYILSLSDLSLADHVRELISSGVSSLKIEGRMKSPLYVYEVTRIYRALLDGERDALPDERNRLKAVFSRGGFTDGYFVSKLFGRMTGVRSESDKEKTKNIESESIAQPKLKISAKASFKLGEPSSLTLYAEAYSRWDSAGVPTAERDRVKLSVSAVGEIPVLAENSPLTAEGVRARLSKMGNTPFELDTSDIDLSLDEGINLSPSAINGLRRTAAERLESIFGQKLEQLCKIESLPLPQCKYNYSNDKPYKENQTSAVFYDVDALYSYGSVRDNLMHRIQKTFVPLRFLENNANLGSFINGICLPPVIMEREWDKVKRILLNLTSEPNRYEYVLIGNISHFKLVEDLGLKIVCDFRMNIFNSKTNAVFLNMGAECAILSPELTLPQARDIGGGVITMGRIPLMITERCFMKENFGCKNCSSIAIKDRKGARFPIMREYEHRNIIFNSSITYMGDRTDELKKAGIRHHHFIFSNESSNEIKKMMESYVKGESIVAGARRVGRR